MSSTIPPTNRPDVTSFEFDLLRRLDSVVSVKANVPEDAFTAEILGTERLGHGAVINDSGLIVTIGYIVTEAESIWIQTNDGQVVAGDLLAYDYESGFGLVQPLGSISASPFELGNGADLLENSSAILAGFGGIEQAINAEIISKSEFVGYWEYIVDEAIYTAPAHPNWGGAALIGADGKLYGIGSLYTQEIPGLSPGEDGNMIVPIDLLKNILVELQTYGQTLKPARPWLGMFAAESDQGLVVAGVYDSAPAFAADLRAGDQIVRVDQRTPRTLGDLFRQIWALGPAGTVVPMQISRDGKLMDVEITSSDRRDHWKSPNVH